MAINKNNKQPLWPYDDKPYDPVKSYEKDFTFHPPGTYIDPYDREKDYWDQKRENEIDYEKERIQNAKDLLEELQKRRLLDSLTAKQKPKTRVRRRKPDSADSI